MSQSEGCRTILVVDDDPLIARMLARVLGSWGHVVVPAMSAPEALAHAAERAFDAVLADHNLGEAMDGLAVLDQIERLHAEAGRRVPALIIMSGELGSWPRPHVSKPFDFGALRSVLGVRAR